LRDPYHHLAGVYDEIVVDPCHSAWADYLDRVWAGAGVVHVLDLCCGTGLMTAELASRGYGVVGLDASPAMLARARTLLGSSAPLVEAVLPDLPLTGPFDAVVSTLDGLNYLPLPPFRQTLAAVAAVLRPGGWLVFDVHADPVLGFLEEHATITGEEQGVAYSLVTDVDLPTRTCRSTLTASGPGIDFAETHVQYVHAAGDIAAALDDAGLELVAVRDEYSDRPVTDTTLRATWIARRPAP
jgi:SAM-dependent methyltransferase